MMLHKPPCRQIEKQARRSLLIQLRVYKKTGKAKCPWPQIHDTDSADVSALHAHGGYFPLTVFCKNGDITNPELSGRKSRTPEGI